MSKKDPDSKPDSKKFPKRHGAIRGRGIWRKPKELYQQAPEPELGEDKRPDPKGSRGDD
jgi:hypothetical protein